MFLRAELREKVKRYVVSNMFHVCINTIIQLTIRKRTNKAIGKFCLNRKSYAAFGGNRRRNIFSFQEVQWCHRYNIFSLIYSILLFGMVDIKLIQSPWTLMILLSCGLVFYFSFKSIFLPWKILLKDDDYQSVWRDPWKIKITTFYVRKPEIIPRI